MNIEMKIMDDTALDAHRVIDRTQSDLNKVSEDIAALYYQVCSVQGITPQRLIVDHLTSKNGAFALVQTQGNNFKFMYCFKF